MLGPKIGSRVVHPLSSFSAPARIDRSPSRSSDLIGPRVANGKSGSNPASVRTTLPSSFKYLAGHTIPATRTRYLANKTSYLPIKVNDKTDVSGNMLGGVARPAVFFPGQLGIVYPLNNYPANTFERPRLNASGSLYYWAYPNYFEVFDVPTAMLKLRFSLSETIQNVETPLAIDEGGRQVFLITDKGLTVVDLGTAPLSVGHLSSTSGAASTQIQVRGSGFVNGLSVKVGGQLATTIFVDENTLKFTVPALASGPHDLTVTDPNGISYTLVSAILAP